MGQKATENQRGFQKPVSPVHNLLHAIAISGCEMYCIHVKRA